MTDMNLATLSDQPLDNLIQMREGIDDAIEQKRADRRRDAMKAADAAARAYGFSLHELMTEDPNARPAVYAHPDDPALTWCGRGRRPKWMTALMKDGWKADDLRI